MSVQATAKSPHYSKSSRPGTRSKKTNSLDEYVNAGPSGLRLTISIGDH